ncbi:MAG: MFS transporter, partial [Bryobacteraceae bacterium]
PAAARVAASPLDARATRYALGAFSLSGLLAAMVGAMLPAWGHHFRTEFVTVGHYFVSMMAGVAISVVVTPILLRRKGVPFVLILSCAMAFVSIVFLAFSAPPEDATRRMAGLAGAGFSMGLLNGGICQVVSAACRHDFATTASMAGGVFGLGCLLVTLLVGGLLETYSPTVILLVAAIMPAIFFVLFARPRFPHVEVPPPPPIREMLADFRSPRALLLAALLFFQFGNEWSIAGWLPIFLIHRLGLSPAAALSILSLYWAALLAGRMGALAILPRFSHVKMLAASAAAAAFGCIILLSTNNQFGAVTGVLMAGLGYSTIFPLTAERIGHRFKYYHPGIFSGIFSFAMVGAMLAPAMGGYLTEWMGFGFTMAIPLIGTVMVFLLSAAIWLEVRINE